jgi:hypothetical protein
MSELRSAVAENFSLTQGGPFYRLLRMFGAADEERVQLLIRVLGALGIAWLPLCVLCLFQGDAYGTHLQIPFFRDIAVNIRFLVALPILILAEGYIDERWRFLVQQFLRSGLIRQPELPLFEAEIRRVIRLRDSAMPEALLAAGTYSSVLFGANTELLIGTASNWHVHGSGLSLAGWWFSFVSAPLIRFLILRWIWRMFLWMLFLWRVSKIHLDLVATHTDLAAGLGFLSLGQNRLCTIVFAGGALVASQVGNAIAHDGDTLDGMKFVLLGYGVLAVLLFVLPVFVMTPKLMRTKVQALLGYGALVASHNQSFAGKWTNEYEPHGDEILGNPDPSSLIDLGSSFQVIQQMRVVPLNRSTLIILATAAILPMIPLVILVTPADQLVGVVLKMLM